MEGNMFLNIKKNPKVEKPTVSEKPPTKIKEKKTDVNILEHINDLSKTYTLVQFDQLIANIHSNINEVKDQKFIKRTICKYARVKKGKIYFNVSKESTEMTFKQLKKELLESKTTKPSGGDFMFSKKTTEICEESEEESDNEDDMWEYSKQQLKYTKKTDEKHGPFGTSWVNDKQFDDPVTSTIERRTKVLNGLMEIEYPEQRSSEWYELRETRATASDGGCIVGMNSHEPQYKFLIKKVLKPPFESNMYCYHGTKLEQIATMVYEYRTNTKVTEFGLVAHPKYSFLAASPDGIVSKYKLDGKHLTKNVGRMLEIKCPVRRQIKTEGYIKGVICPIYYWVQVQLQLECCNLDECDFWQCDIAEYDDREDFIRDTDKNEPFRSRTSGMEKGCLIQVISKDRIEDVKNGDYLKVIWEDSKHIYPPKVEMTPEECDKWIAETMSQFNKTCPNGYYFDKVIYWKLMKTHNVTIKRDKEWFKEYLPTIEKLWNYVLYFRKNEEKSKIFFDYIQHLPIKNNKKIMNLAEYMYNEPDDSDNVKVKEYTKKIHEIIQETLKNKKEKEEIDAIDEE